MTVADMQARVDAWISQFEEGYFSPQGMILRLTEELGELAREVNHQFGEKPKKPSEPEGSLAMELGDLLFVVVSFANALGLDLNDVFNAVMAKYEERDKGRWTPKASQ
ncbi:MAG: nucleotide pyrophosphohydrolase [Sulfobacillus thermosulfidooxidans]|uniref:Nucleotide pyrophosphohydrolase n=1 Tax=Sulfobacillus thermotolerans TaxID=338644 RepID=A0ABN5GWJ4_9FIRM|nr:nucleotide pyrophosphohydrolase [Sulfobacillus sp. hq2]AUW92704.1 nucleotide pyrophosphohydrolase [Sulfobacillus thermotolerans]MCY0907706.1 nucleotide pyrophosphohydrolase [Sulfobacillus thermotolerans]POB12097.1 nucleotide pyrophosphohydrolase [Sulfobacillus sp. hq2]PSR37812.1 MAG: nucleotide pyrophosphohydrolase [Sulfobacillus thermosulfidooxidans]